jgi:hypothetical protein
VNVSFQYGTTTAYGSSSVAQKTGPDNGSDALSAPLTGLPAGTTIHYRAVAVSDFGTFAGADQTLTTNSSPPPPPTPPGPGTASVRNATVSGTTASVRVTCAGAAGATCGPSRHQLKVTLGIAQALGNGRTNTVSTQRVTFKAPKRRHRRR